MSESTAAVAAAETVPETAKDAGVAAGGRAGAAVSLPPPPQDARVAMHVAATKRFAPVDQTKRDLEGADTDTVSSLACRRRAGGSNTSLEGRER
ncbi:MAG TPA: hypothetical protein VFR86_02250 [Burkholderiaceae bacterium]|nr:hypothetical protein [Burkholderiaceae bacterium]